MTDQSFPITPPDALRTQWRTEAPIYRDFGVGRENWLMNRAAQWGWDQRGTINEAQLQERADQELEACVNWLIENQNPRWAHALRAARRPKPPSLKEQALAALNVIEDKMLGPTTEEILIRKALEALPND